MIQFFEETEEEENEEGICVTEGHVANKETYPPLECLFKSQKASDNWISAVSRVRIGIRVMRGFQFYSCRSLARAVGHGSNLKERSKSQDKDLGHLPVILKRICRKIRSEDQCMMVVELTTPEPQTSLFYLVMVRHMSQEGYKEDMLVGAEVSIAESVVGEVRFSFYIPLLSNVRVELHGENKFIVFTPQDSYLLKPSTVQSQWAALNFITDSVRRAQEENFYDQGSTHWWCSQYLDSQDQRTLDPYWRHKHRTEEEQQATTLLDIFGSRKRRKSAAPTVVEPIINGGTGLLLEELKTRAILQEIRNVMHVIDLETATCQSVRAAVEANLKTDLTDCKEWVNQQLLVIYGQMDEPSLIVDYIYLGNEWNACNLEELQENGITHILNCTSEIDSFYENEFHYLRLDVLDVPQANLLVYWQQSYNFIKECQEQGGKVLIHCQMGVSRSASTTIAFLMAHYNYSFSHALQLTRSKRSVVKPNSGFHKQLEQFEEILQTHSPATDDLTDILKTTTVTCAS